MRKLRLYIAASLDGYIARRDGALDWLPPPQGDAGDYGYAEFIARIDTVVMGRKTYDKSVQLSGADPFPGMRCLVFSRRLAGQRTARAEYPDAPPAQVLRRIKQEPGRDLWLIGGGEMIRHFLDAGLVDEIILTVVPVLIGDGVPLFPPGRTDTRFALVQSHAFPDGLVQLTYVLQSTQPHPGAFPG